MNKEITKDADYLLCVLYKEYKFRRADGLSKQQARFFGDAEDIFNCIFKEWDLEDLEAACGELKETGFINCYYADDTACSIFLSNKAFIYMENRFKNNMESLLDYITKIKKIIF